MSRSKEKSRTRIGFEYGLGFFMALCVFKVAMGLLDYTVPINGTDHDWWNRSGAEIITDYRTGVQYLRTDSGITPRIDRDGVPVLGAKAAQ